MQHLAISGHLALNRRAFLYLQSEWMCADAVHPGILNEKSAGALSLWQENSPSPFFLLSWFYIACVSFGSLLIGVIPMELYPVAFSSYIFSPVPASVIM